jgi:hypothetical protein
MVRIRADLVGQVVARQRACQRQAALALPDARWPVVRRLKSTHRG